MPAGGGSTYGANSKHSEALINFELRRLRSSTWSRHSFLACCRLPTTPRSHDMLRQIGVRDGEASGHSCGRQVVLGKPRPLSISCHRRGGVRRRLGS